MVHLKSTYWQNYTVLKNHAWKLELNNFNRSWYMYTNPVSTGTGTNPVLTGTGTNPVLTGTGNYPVLTGTGNNPVLTGTET